MTKRWTASDMPTQTGRTWLITGATSGIGLEAAKAASRAGATVILAVRNVAKGEAVAHSLSGPAAVVELDLGSLASVRRAADATPQVDVLVNNAGRVTTHRQETEDGFECLLGTNALGPFAFTNLVAEKVADRVVIVGSDSHRGGVLDFDDPQFVHRRWSTGAAYSQSKLADMVWGLGLSRRFTRVVVQLCHPGWAGTGISNVTGNDRLDRLVTGANKLVGQPAWRGALPTLFAATQDLPSCSYTGPDSWLGQRGYPALASRSAAASDPVLATRWWEFAAKATGTDLA
jgi:NAD(P)-dependent dehydrogenase (short-subunit alcohol dehydrogenase family)